MGWRYTHLPFLGGDVMKLIPPGLKLIDSNHWNQLPKHHYSFFVPPDHVDQAIPGKPQARIEFKFGSKK